MPDKQTFIFITITVLFFSIALHEYGHAKSADAAGDPTPRMMGRVTLNPLAHFDPLGAMMIVFLVISGFGIGWGKPVQTDPSKMENPRWDSFMSVLWGPLTNLIIAVICAALFKMLHPGVESLLFWFLYLGVIVNISLALFNLIPLGPLDGHWLVAYLLPPQLGARFAFWSRTSGSFLLLAIIIMDQFIIRDKYPPGILMSVLDPPRQFVARLLGVPI